MTTEELIKANHLNEQMKEAKTLLHEIETGKLICVTVRVYDQDKHVYYDRELRNIPSSAIKKVLIEDQKAAYENRQRQFEKFLTPRESEHEVKEIQPLGGLIDSVA